MSEGLLHCHTKSVYNIVNSVYDSNQGGRFQPGGGSALSSYDRTLIHVHDSEFKNNTAAITDALSYF